MRSPFLPSPTPRRLLPRDSRLADHLKFGDGGLFALNFVPEQLRALYDGNPKGAMAFVRLKID